MLTLPWRIGCALTEKWFAISPGWPEEKLLEQLLNRYLEKELTDDEFDFLRGCRIGIESRQPGYAIKLELDNNRLRVSKSHLNISGCDVVIKGEAFDLLQILLGNMDPDTLFFQRRIVVEGNTEIGLGIKNKLDAIEVERIPPWLRKILTSALRIVRPEVVRS